uniref:Uncharacterized protein n=1 Tax=viral metagenome TaxID=1070528 RepID=A0A6H1Z6R7_9ZZZZ
MEGLGEWVQTILLKGGEIYGQIQGAKYAAETSQAQVTTETAKAKSKQWLYLGIGVIGAALLLSFAKKASRA